ncbi:phage tail assembly protein (plasmid) [Tistrella mobilis]|uniref:phage tail assembly protein n=1 Tax=Tistrella mobilis TaxID=171437 RepID=UPI0035567FB0
MTDTVTIRLDTPVTVDGVPTDQIVLTRPRIGQLRGVKLLDVYQMEVGAVAELISRTSTPVLDPAVIDGFDPADFTRLCVGLLGFFGSGSGSTPTNSQPISR